MTTRLLGAVTMLALVAACLPLAAQTATMSVNITFEFSAGGKIHPAGDYRVTASSGTTLIGFSSFDAQVATQVLASRGDEYRRRSDTSRLVFRRYGDRYFLAEMWNAGASVARRVTPTKEETELARTLGGRRSRP
jgi:hypothetical protein